jgi:preprotein translocase SecE subunit
VADSEEPKRSKRRLRAPNQTIRERAEQAQQTAAQPAKSRHVRAAADSASRPLRGAAKIFRYQPFKFIAKVLRVIGRVLVPSYFRNSWRELRLVEWPNRKQSRQLTGAVLGFAIVFGALVATVDYGLDKVFKAILLK